MSRTSLSRRALLTGVEIGGLATVAGCGATGSRSSQRPATGQLLRSRIPLPGPWSTELPRVPVATGRRQDGVTAYTLTQRPAEVEILPGRRTEVWGYDGLFPGPTVEARRGRPVRLTVVNQLPVPTSTHLHGGVTAAEHDGSPVDLVVPAGFDVSTLGHGGHHGAPAPSSPDPGGGHEHGPGQRPDLTGWTLHAGRRDHHYDLAQRAALLWYHDHRMDYSGPQVWRGLAGAFVIRDEEEDALGLPSGEQELVLTLTDRSFGPDGELLYPSLDPTLTHRPGVEPAFMDGVLGDVMLVNGAPSPRTVVPAARLRLRLLNASNARPLRLEARAAGVVLPLTQIGTDVGLLPRPVRRDRLDLHPAERVDVVLDLSGLAVGSTVELRNLFAHAGSGDRTGDVLQLVVDHRTRDDSRVPEVLVPDHEVLDADQVVAERRFDFRLTGQLWTVNGTPYDPVGSLATIELGTVERWVLTSDFNHPVHVHLGHFQVVADSAGLADTGSRGWKDTVNVTPYGSVEVLVRFEQHRGRYMLHCHNLEHEDMAMMANFTVA